MKHLTSLFDLSRGDIEEILATAGDLKGRYQKGERPPLWQGRVLVQIFEKPSLRTRMSFEAAACQLGGTGTFLNFQDAGLNGRETLPDVVRVLSSYSDAIVLRTYSQQLIEDFAALSRCPVINGLSDEHHPCQALTDLLTIRETFNNASSPRIVYVGDGNNVAASLAILAAREQLPITFCAPNGFQLSAAFLAKLKTRIPTSNITLCSDPQQAVADADVIYTDVWASMGQEAETAHRQQAFASYQVNAQLLSKAPKHCRFMHCMPAHRGDEVTDDVIDGPQSLAFQQAENRMHLAKGLLVWLSNHAQAR